MTVSSLDLKAVRLPVFALVVAIGIASAVIEYSASKRDQAEKLLRDQSAALEDARGRYQRSGDERESILRYMPTYRQLVKQGFIGEEQRLNWVESLRTANSQAGLFGILYQISAQEPYVLPSENPLAQRVRHSKMSVAFGIVHEGDLLRFIRAMEAQQAGNFALTHCSISRGVQAEAPQARRENLAAECDLSWLTLNVEGIVK
jgi:hypothetical protein